MVSYRFFFSQLLHWKCRKFSFVLLVTFKLQFQDGNSPTPNSSLGKWNHGGCLQNECKLGYSKVFTEPKGYSWGINRSA